MIENENIYNFSIGLKALIINDNGEALIVKRSKTIAKANLYDFPGGRIRHGESLRSGLIREVFEEVGLKLTTIGRPLTITTFIRDIDQTNQIVRIIFVAKADGKIRIDQHEIAEYKWIKPEDNKNFHFIDENYFQAFENLLNGHNTPLREFMFDGVLKDSKALLN